VAQGDPHLPELRRSTQDPYTDNNEEKTRILAERFFPNTGHADLSDIIPEGTPQDLHHIVHPWAAPTGNAGDTQAEDGSTMRIPISPQITADQLKELVRKLPNGKAPGPDGIPNEALKVAVPAIAGEMAQAISSSFAGGTLPNRFKESTTIVLKKEGKKDYSLPGSYWPIALENTLAKVMEKAVADAMAKAVEEHNLLPWNQMGARKRRSTLSAISLLTACLQTAWRT